MRTQDMISECLRQHGFDHVVNASGAVTFDVPYVNIHTGEEGWETYTVRTLEETKVALGY